MGNNACKSTEAGWDSTLSSPTSNKWANLTNIRLLPMSCKVIKEIEGGKGFPRRENLLIPFFWIITGKVETLEYNKIGTEKTFCWSDFWTEGAEAESVKARTCTWCVCICKRLDGDLKETL